MTKSDASNCTLSISTFSSSSFDNSQPPWTIKQRNAQSVRKPGFSVVDRVSPNHRVKAFYSLFKHIFVHYVNASCNPRSNSLHLGIRQIKGARLVSVCFCIHLFCPNRPRLGAIRILRKLNKAKARSNTNTKETKL